MTAREPLHARIHRIAAVLWALAAALLAGAPAGAVPTPQGGGADNVVLVRTTRDGSATGRAGVQIAHVGSPSVAGANVASAEASDCTGCHSTAVAVQVLLATGSPQSFAPRNAAVAVNSGCRSCGTFAYAWQYVLQVDGPAHLGPEGRRRANELERQIGAVAESSALSTLDDALVLGAGLDRLTAQLREVIEREIRLGNVKAIGKPTVRSERSHRRS